MACGLAPLHRAGHLNGAAEQQLFGRRGLARVRMADDGEPAIVAGSGELALLEASAFVPWGGQVASLYCCPKEK